MRLKNLRDDDWKELMDLHAHPQQEMAHMYLSSHYSQLKNVQNYEQLHAVKQEFTCKTNIITSENYLGTQIF